MTGQLDGYESETLFNSMQEGGQGVFSLMVDLKNIVDFGEPKNLNMAVVAREVLVGQELRLELNERSVSPEAGEIKVVWSNGFEGPTYHVRPEDLGTTLTATAIFEGADMRPLEVTIQCGPVVIAPAPTMDRSLITLTGARDASSDAFSGVAREVAGGALSGALGGASFESETIPASGIREFEPACLYVDSRAFSSAVDSIDVTWFVGGEEAHTETGITPAVLTSQLDIERITTAHEPAPVQEIPADTPIAELPNLLAELLGGTLMAGLGGGSSSAVLGAEAGVVASGQGEGATEDSTGHAFESTERASDSDAVAVASLRDVEPAEILVDVTEPFFAAQFIPPQGSAGTSLTVQITAHAQGAESAIVRLNGGWIGQGVAFQLKNAVAVRVADPRVGEAAWAKVKRRDFSPAAEKFTYQWLINGRDLEGETSSHLDVTPMMRGRELSVLIEVSGAKAMTSTLEASLGVVGLGDAPEYLGEDLAITGKPKVGKTLSVSNLEHEFILPEADSIEIQWMRGKELIPGERGMNHVVDLRDVDEKLWARVTLRKLGHASAVLKTPKVRVR